MATRSIIAARDTISGTFRAIYCHWDGYPAHQMPILSEHFNTPEKIKALMDLGNLSILGADTETPNPFNGPRIDGACMAYGRDRGDENTGAMTWSHLQEVKRMARDCGAEFIYFGDFGQWACFVRQIRINGERVWVDALEDI